VSLCIREIERQIFSCRKVTLKNLQAFDEYQALRLLRRARTPERGTERRGFSADEEKHLTRRLRSLKTWAAVSVSVSVSVFTRRPFSWKSSRFQRGTRGATTTKCACGRRGRGGQPAGAQSLWAARGNCFPGSRDAAKSAVVHSGPETGYTGTTSPVRLGTRTQAGGNLQGNPPLTTRRKPSNLTLGTTL